METASGPTFSKLESLRMGTSVRNSGLTSSAASQLSTAGSSASALKVRNVNILSHSGAPCIHKSAPDRGRAITGRVKPQLEILLSPKANTSNFPFYNNFPLTKST